jgi:hypothetical protein
LEVNSARQHRIRGGMETDEPALPRDVLLVRGNFCKYSTNEKSSDEDSEVTLPRDILLVQGKSHCLSTDSDHVQDEKPARIFISTQDEKTWMDSTSEANGSDLSDEVSTEVQDVCAVKVSFNPQDSMETLAADEDAGVAADAGITWLTQSLSARSQSPLVKR